MGIELMEAVQPVLRVCDLEVTFPANNGGWRRWGDFVLGAA